MKMRERYRMSSIPEEICFEILLKVPVKSLLACKFVCKTWFSLISSHDFVKTHLDLTKKRNNPSLLVRWYDNWRVIIKNLYFSISHSQELLLSTDSFLDYLVETDYPFKPSCYSVRFMGSCDGLVCLWFNFRQSLCLWNPATSEYKELPKSNVYNVGMVAFGYDYKSNNYKLLIGNYESLFKVYLPGSNSWKTIENIPYIFPSVSRPSEVVVNGDGHWLAKRKDLSDVLVSLNLSNDIFNEIELPKKHLDQGYRYCNLGVLEGCLCLFVDADCVDFEVWVMQDYGVQESWTKRCAITHDRFMTDGYATFVSYFKSGMILFEVSGKLVIYDPKNKTVIEPNIPGSMHSYQQSYYFESLVSLNSGTYVGLG